jgi:hypothetical protein
MAGPYDFLSGAPYGFDDWSDPGEAARAVPNHVILHDYGRTPEGGFQRGSFIPYHYLITQDGRIIQRYRPDQIAPHAFHSNPGTIGIAYGAPVGAEPTPRARAAMEWFAKGLPRRPRSRRSLALGRSLPRR